MVVVVGLSMTQVAHAQLIDANIVGPRDTMSTPISDWEDEAGDEGPDGDAPLLCQIAKATLDLDNGTMTIQGDFMLCDELIVCTDDGSRGRQALVTEPEREFLENKDSLDRIWVVGPTVMMKYASLTSKPFGVPTIVSLNPIMVDGTGMCGGCRVSVGGKTRFACVDGPEFDAHMVDFDQLSARNAAYRSFEGCQMVLADD